MVVDLAGIHGRRLWLRYAGANAYRLCFWLLFTPGLMTGFAGGQLHLALVPGIRRLPFAIGAVAGVPLLILGVLTAVHVYRTFGIDRLFYLYMFYPEDGRMAQHEIYGFICHPQYASFLYTDLAIVLLKGSLESLALLVPVLLFAAGRIVPEERELLARFGELYATYRRATPAMIPHWRSWRGFLRHLFAPPRRPPA